MAVEMVVANGSFCFLFFGPEKESNPGPWILGPTEIACAIRLFPHSPDRQTETEGTWYKRGRFKAVASWWFVGSTRVCCLANMCLWTAVHGESLVDKRERF